MATMGRPTKLDQIVLVRDDGSTVTAGQQIIDRVQLGMTLAAAADSAGVDRSTLHRWRVAGARYRADQAQGRLPDPTREQQGLIDFCNALERAEAEAEVARLGIVQRAAVGGQAIKKTTIKYATIPATDKEPARRVEVERIEVEETLAPQWAAAAWWLERRRGYVKRYELTGAEGSPLVPPGEAARDLAESLREFQAGVETEKKMAEETNGKGST